MLPSSLSSPPSSMPPAEAPLPLEACEPAAKTFQRSVPTFLNAAADLYTPQAFDVPANPLPAPLPPADWLSYEGPEDPRSPQYLAFRASPTFLRVRQQMLDRMDDIETFARRHASPTEFPQWREGLNAFRNRLLDPAETFVGQRMPLLYGAGKRALDQVCQRLLQDELPLDFRRRHLREMCHQLQMCMATGPAFLQTARALAVDPNGLRSAFLDVIRTHADEVFRRTYRREHLREVGWVRDNWEVHGVNRMRLEYGMPGADPSDSHSFSNHLFWPDGQAEHLERLRRALNPCTVAGLLADHYLELLSHQLPACVPELASREDLNPVFPVITAAVGSVNEALTPVSMLSLMEEDEATGTYCWRQDRSLVQRDVLLGLERAGLVTPQPRVTLASCRDDHHGWTLEAVDDQLFYVEMTSALQPEPQALPVGVSHLLAFERQQPARGRHLGAGGGAGADACPPLFPEGLLATLLRGAPPQALGSVPARWLTQQSDLEDWLQRISGPAFKLWLKTHPPARLPAPLTLASLADAVTEAARVELLEALLDSVPDAPRDPRLIAPAAQAMAWTALTNPAIVDAWYQHLRRAGPTLSPAMAACLFCGEERPRPLARAIRENDGPHARRMLDLLALALQRGVLPLQALARGLDHSVSEAMRYGSHDALNAVSDFLLNGSAQGLLAPAELKVFLGGRHPGQGCESALAEGRADTLQWYFDLISRLHSEGALTSASLGALVAEPSPQHAVASHSAVFHDRPEALRTFLGRLIQSTVQGQLDPARLKHQLTCDGPDQSGLLTLVKRTHPACLHVWRESVREAHRAGLLQPRDVRNLVAGQAFSDAPLLPRLLTEPGGQGGLKAWSDTVTWLFKEGVLAPPDVVALLRGDDPADRVGEPPLMNDLMRAYRDPVRISSYVDLVGQMTYRGLLSAEAAEALLSGPDPTGSTPALIDAVRHSSRPVIEAFLRGLMTRARAGILSPEAVLRLMDGRSRVGRSALTTAIRHNNPEMLALLLNKAADFFRQDLIGKAHWLSLLEPEPPAPGHLPVDGALDAVEQLNPEALKPILLQAVRQVSAQGMLDDDEATHLLHRITVRAAEAEARRAAGGPPPFLTP